ncbi:MAG: hypothetical protein Q8M24_15755 [Pseudolabrys sp.]|nr:hypothetical protein [Pseudolabrys sp.]MDP2296898.1 hypothetical protein [Pseudolabrys sp.]
MRILSLAAAASLVLLACGPLAAQTADVAPGTTDAAQEPAPPEATARYAFSRVEAGFLRFDSVSGQVALCSQRSTGWACQAVPDDRAALDSEFARLQNEVTQLKSEIAALRAPAEPPRPPAELAPRGEGDAKTGTLKLPTDEDIKWARAAIQKVWQQFIDMVAELQKDMQRKG